MKLALIDIDTLALCHPSQVLCLSYLQAEIRTDSAKTIIYAEAKKNTVVFGVGKDKQPGYADKGTIEYHKNIGNQEILDAAAKLTTEDNHKRLSALSERFNGCKCLLFTSSFFQVNQINTLFHAYGFSQLYNCLDLKTIAHCCSVIDPNMKLKKSKTVKAEEVLTNYSFILGHSCATTFLFNNFGR